MTKRLFLNGKANVPAILILVPVSLVLWTLLIWIGQAVFLK